LSVWFCFRELFHAEPGSSAMLGCDFLFGFAG
jgi:hypothetical protein